MLWEFWNFWSRAKWHYTVPIMERWKIFEMPLPGYFGFPPFALECFTMYVFVRRLVTRGGRTIALLIAAKEWQGETTRQGSLADFFAASPLRGSGLRIERRR